MSVNLVTALDDYNSATARSEGWAFFSIPEPFVSEFVEKSSAILNKTKIKAFHGKKFERRFDVYYKDFLTLVRDTLSGTSESLLAVTLMNETWKQDYSGFCARLIEGGFSGAGLGDQLLTDGSIALATPLFTYQRLASHFPPDASTSFEIDADAVTTRLVDLVPMVSGKAIDPLIPISAAYRAYRNERFPSSPLLNAAGIQIRNDEDSFLIQAADIFANFSVAYTFRKLGFTSKTIELKADIFDSCFQDILPDDDLGLQVEKINDDLVLKHDGSWTLTIG